MCLFQRQLNGTNSSYIGIPSCLGRVKTFPTEEPSILGIVRHNSHIGHPYHHQQLAYVDCSKAELMSKF
jgi:hypothetical protein